MTLNFQDRPAMDFDQVVFACHGDQVLPLLEQPTRRRARRAGKLQNQPQRGNAAHGCFAAAQPTSGTGKLELQSGLEQEMSAVAVTYHMNRLQSLKTAEDYCVTLNGEDAIDPREGAAEDCLPSPALHARGGPRTRQVERDQRPEPDALLRGVLVLRLSRGWIELGIARGPRAFGGVLAMDSAIYFGTVRHRRFRPVPHQLLLWRVHGVSGY